MHPETPGHQRTLIAHASDVLPRPGPRNESSAAHAFAAVWVDAQPMDRAAALAQLGDSFAVALRLRDRGHSDEEIAEILGIPFEAVASHVALAEAKLARVVPERDDGADGELP